MAKSGRDINTTVETIYFTYLHIGIIMSALGLGSYGYAFGLYPKRFIQIEILSILINSLSTPYVYFNELLM